MPYTSTDIIIWAKATQTLASVNEPKRLALVGKSITPSLDQVLFVERRSLEWQLQQDPTDVDGLLFAIGNYVLSLIGMYLSEAQIASGSGGGLVPDPVIPTPGESGLSIFPIVVTASDFESDGVTYNNSEIVGINLMVFVSGYSQEWLFAPDFFNYTTNGIIVVASGFSMADYARMIIQNFNSNTSGSSPAAVIPPIVVNYDLTANGTLIENVVTTTDGQPVVIFIKPNGFTYTWDTDFLFSDSLPEQPGAIGVGTTQMYEFIKSSTLNKLKISAESVTV